MSKEKVRTIEVPEYIEDPMVVSKAWFNLLYDAYRIVCQLRPVFKEEGNLNRRNRR